MLEQTPSKRHAVSSETRRPAKELRRGQTVAEEKLWGYLRNRALLGHKFRRQYPIEGFIVDFSCPERLLMIEVDGPTHEGREAYDLAREERLRQLGYRTLRFTNQDVLLNIEAVLNSVIRALAPSP